MDGSPNTRSVTFDYEKVLGWKRILIEGDPKYRNSMIENSPLAFSVNAAICEQATKVHFLSADYTGGIAEFMGNDFMKTYHRDIYNAATIPGNISSINWESLEGKNRKVSVIECLPLSLILKKAKVKHINWFILDVEVKYVMIILFLVIINDIMIIIYSTIGRGIPNTTINKLGKCSI